VSPALVLGVSLPYIGLLFVVAWLGDRRAERRPEAGTSAVLYALTLAVYTTAWSFYGHVGRAADSGFVDFAPIYLGPTIALVFGRPVLRKVLRVAKAHNATSIADFIAARYGKSQGLAALVAGIGIVGVLPYIALQLKAVTTSFEVVTAAPVAPADLPPWQDTAFGVALAMAVFTILFGVRHIHASEHHRGLMVAIAFESLMKLLAFLVVAVFIAYGLYDGLGDLYGRALTDPRLAHVMGDPSRLAPWTTLLLSVVAVLCLPQLFHVAVVENTDTRHVDRASALFPAYLAAIGLFILPIAVAGLDRFGAGRVDPDTYMITLPMAAGQADVALVAFLGGLSASTGMVIVAAVALSTMACNDVVMPLLLRVRRLRMAERADLAGPLLATRRLAVVAILLLAYAYARLIGPSFSLATIGMSSFVAVAQLAPALLVGLYWRGATKAGAFAGLSAGFAVWAHTLFLPSLAEAGWLSADIMERGPWGAGWLRPHALFGIEGLDPISHATFWSLLLNLAALVGVSLATSPSAVERRQASAFVDGEGGLSNGGRRVVASLPELELLTARFLGPERAAAAFADYARRQGEEPGPADMDAVHFTERLLAGAIGAPSARVVMATSLQARTLSRGDAMAMLDEATEAIKFNRELLQATLENVTQGICVFDRQHRLAAWNRRYLELLDFPEELVRAGTQLADLVRFNQERGEYGGEAGIETLMTRRPSPDRRPGPYSYERTRPDGTVLRVTSNPMPDGGFVATFTDVTQRRRAEAALREAKEGLEVRVAERTRALELAKAEAERANQSKTRFLAAASHDLLQPLNAARLFSSALLGLDAAEVGPRARELADKVDASLRSVEHLLGALMDISKLDAGVVRPRRSHFKLDGLLAPLGVEFAALARDRGLSFRIRGGGVVVESDPQMLRRVLQNLLSNAVRYTRSGGVLLACRRRGERVRIEVWDTGTGIPEDRIDEIFVEFRRLGEDEGAGADRGLGLGLAIVERTARMLGHPIEVRSRLGRGTRFAIEVPLGRAPARARPARPVAPVADLRRSLVLCLDNEPAIRDGMRALLEGWGCEVATAPDADQALAALGGRRPDAVFVDYHLDDRRNGLSELDRLRATWGRDVPAVLVTADRGDEVKEASRRRGCALLYKPIRPAALRALLGRMLAETDAEEGAEATAD
jgi:Na+/proline symporter/signal transduction histidine kinase/ActR/RegA family two-component response regulator